MDIKPRNPKIMSKWNRMTASFGFIFQIFFKIFFRLFLNILLLHFTSSSESTKLSESLVKRSRRM